MDKKIATFTPATDFKEFQFALFERLDNKIEKLDQNIDKKMNTIRNVVVVFLIFLSFLFWFLNDKYQTDISRLKSVVYTPTNQSLQDQINKISSYIEFKKKEQSKIPTSKPVNKPIQKSYRK